MSSEEEDSEDTSVGYSKESSEEQEQDDSSVGSSKEPSDELESDEALMPAKLAEEGKNWVVSFIIAKVCVSIVYKELCVINYEMWAPNCTMCAMYSRSFVLKTIVLPFIK